MEDYYQDLIKIIDFSGERVVDLSVVREYVTILESSFKGQYPLMLISDPSTLKLLDIAKNMSNEQLQYLVNELSHRLTSMVRLNRFLQTKEGLKSTCKLRQLVKLYDKLGASLWEDNNELRD